MSPVSASNAAITASTGATNTVSWQSAYFALLATAINVLVQNAGMVCGLPSYDRIVARSSPIICLADTLLITIKFNWLQLLGCSPRTAARHVWYDRFENNPEGRRDSGIDHLWRFNIIFFILGALPQSIKVFGMRGIPGTQTWTAFFLAAFLVPEFLRLFAGTAHAEDLTPMPIISRAKVHFTYLQDLTVLVSGILQYCIWVWVASYFVPTSLFYTINKTYDFVAATQFYIILTDLLCWILLTLLILLCLYVILIAATWLFNTLDSYYLHHNLSYKLYKVYGYIISFLGNILGASDEQVKSVISILTNIVWGIFCLSLGYFCSGPVYLHVFSHPITYTPALRLLGAGLGIVLGFLLCHLLFRVAFMGRFSRYPKQVFGLDGMFGEFFSIFLFLMDFATVLAYYAYIYDAQGTYKPSWTEKLG